MRNALIFLLSIVLVIGMAISQQGCTKNGDLLRFPLWQADMKGWWHGSYSSAFSAFSQCDTDTVLNVQGQNGSIFWGDISLTGCAKFGSTRATILGVVNGSMVQMNLVYDNNATSSWKGQVTSAKETDMPHFYGIAETVRGNLAILGAFDLKKQSGGK